MAGRKVTVGLPRKVVFVESEGVDWDHVGETIRSACAIGFNVINLGSFIQSGYSASAVPGPDNIARAWQELEEVEKRRIMDFLHARGTILLVTAGGVADTDPYLVDSKLYAQRACEWAVRNLLDGVNFDLGYIERGFKFKSKTSEDMYAWFRELNAAARATLGADRTLSHSAPLHCWSVQDRLETWPGPRGGYVQVFRDHASVDFFNLRVAAAPLPPALSAPVHSSDSSASPRRLRPAALTYTDVFLYSPSFVPYSAVSQLGGPGAAVPLSKLVLAVDRQTFDNPCVLSQWMQRAYQDLGWNAGLALLSWNTQHFPSARDWFQLVYGGSPFQALYLHFLGRFLGEACFPLAASPLSQLSGAEKGEKG